MQNDPRWSFDLPRLAKSEAELEICVANRPRRLSCRLLLGEASIRMILAYTFSPVAAPSMYVRKIEH